MLRLFCVALALGLVAPADAADNSAKKRMEIEGKWKHEMTDHLTVIIHGDYPEEEAMNWPIDLMGILNATNESPELPGDHARAFFTYDGDDPGYFPDRSELIPELDVKPKFSKFLLYNWRSKENKKRGAASSEEVVTPLYEAIKRRAITYKEMTKDKMNIHFICHDRGAAVAARVAERLKSAKELHCVHATRLDPRSNGDGPLPADFQPDCGFDWQTTFKSVEDFEKGASTDESISYDIKNTILAWRQADSRLDSDDIPLICYWYHWKLDGGSNDIAYTDPINLYLKDQMTSGLRMTLYATSPIFQDFRDDSLDGLSLHSSARVVDNEVLLTTLAAGKVGAMWTRERVTGDFMVDFSFRMTDPRIVPGEKWGTADGLTLILAKNNSIKFSRGGHLSGINGITPSIGIAFDAYANRKGIGNNGDPVDTENYVSLRRNGSPMHIGIPRDYDRDQGRLPEASTSGNRFLVRLIHMKKFDENLHKEVVMVTIAIYSFGQDELKIINDIPTDDGWKIDSLQGVHVAVIGANGAGWQKHRVLGEVLIGSAIKD